MKNYSTKISNCMITVLLIIFIFADIICLYSFYVQPRDKYKNLTFENAAYLDTYSSIPKIKKCENEIINFLDKNEFQVISIDEGCQKEKNTSLLIASINVVAKKKGINYNITTKFKKGIMCDSILKLEGKLTSVNLSKFDFFNEYLDSIAEFINIHNGYLLLKNSYSKIEKKRENVYSYKSNNKYNISLFIQQTYNKDYYFSYIIGY